MRVEIQSEWAIRREGVRAASQVLALTMAITAGLLGLGCLGWGGANAVDPAMQDATLRAARIEVLRDEIKRDHRSLEGLITQPGQAADASLHDHPELRAIATRLTEQEQDLEALLAMDADETARRGSAK